MTMTPDLKNDLASLISRAEMLTAEPGDEAEAALEVGRRQALAPPEMDVLLARVSAMLDGQAEEGAGVMNDAPTPGAQSDGREGSPRNRSRRASRNGGVPGFTAFRMLSPAGVLRRVATTRYPRPAMAAAGLLVALVGGYALAFLASSPHDRSALVPFRIGKVIDTETMGLTQPSGHDVPLDNTGAVGNDYTYLQLPALQSDPRFTTRQQAATQNPEFLQFNNRSASPIDNGRSYSVISPIDGQAGSPGTHVRSQLSNVVVGENHSSDNILGQVQSPRKAGSGLPADIIRTSSVMVRVHRNGLAAAEKNARTIAGKAGGYVSADSRNRGQHAVYITMRVPAKQFSTARSRLEALGLVLGEVSNSRDVSLQVVDLGARLLSLEAQRAELLRLFSQSQSVSDTIRIQNVLAGVQTRIETAQGRARYLRSRISMATISAEFVTKTQVAAPVRHHRHHLTGVVKAFADSGRAVVKVVEGIIIAVGYLFVPALVGLAVIAVLRMRRRGRERAAAES